MILISRPEPKATATYRILSDAGIDCYICPAIAIKAIPHKSIGLTLSSNSAFDVVVVTSTFTSDFLREHFASFASKSTRFICVGAGSAAMLKQLSLATGIGISAIALIIKSAWSP